MTDELHRRVLVVDDDCEVRSILVRSLQHKSLVIDEAEDGAQALELLQEYRYGVVLLDIFMPGVDGFGVLDAIDETSPDAPVVLVITGAGARALGRLDSRKIHGVVKKPFEPLEVAEIVAACADIRGRGAFETMALATMISGAPLIALLKL